MECGFRSGRQIRLNPKGLCLHYLRYNSVAQHSHCTQGVFTLYYSLVETEVNLEFLWVLPYS